MYIYTYKHIYDKDLLEGWTEKNPILLRKSESTEELIQGENKKLTKTAHH